jgi:hypothetical protein
VTTRAGTAGSQLFRTVTDRDYAGWLQERLKALLSALQEAMLAETG